MFFIELSNGSNFIHRLLITNMAANRIGRVGWIHHDAAFTDNLHGLSNQSVLWIFFMDLEKLAH